jgi:hypothetical protein
VKESVKAFFHLSTRDEFVEKENGRRLAVEAKMCDRMGKVFEPLKLTWNPLNQANEWRKTRCWQLHGSLNYRESRKAELLNDEHVYFETIDNVERACSQGTTSIITF